MEEVAGVRVVHLGEGPYPKRCDFCTEGIVAGERFVVLEDARVLHETCAFLLNEEADLGLE